MSSEGLHIPRELLSQDGRLLHHAITSLKEELDAADWYRQRADDTEDEPLKAILLHNMREEIEHAAMLIEWLRRNSADFAEHLKTYLFSQAPITGIERIVESTAGSADASRTRPSPGITIGSLKGAR